MGVQSGEMSDREQARQLFTEFWLTHAYPNKSATSGPQRLRETPAACFHVPASARPMRTKIGRLLSSRMILAFTNVTHALLRTQTNYQPSLQGQSLAIFASPL